MTEPFIPYGRRIADGKNVSIDEVPTGKECDCVCIRCEKPLVAKNSRFTGRKRRPHFSHLASVNAYCDRNLLIHTLAIEAIKRGIERAIEGGDVIPPALDVPIMRSCYDGGTGAVGYHRSDGEEPSRTNPQRPLRSLGGRGRRNADHRGCLHSRAIAAYIRPLSKVWNPCRDCEGQDRRRRHSAGDWHLHKCGNQLPTDALRQVSTMGGGS